MSDLPSGWVSASVDELAATGGITDGPFGSNLKTSHYTDSGPRVVRLQNIGDGTFSDERAHISDEHFELLTKHEVRENDVLVASLGEMLPRACLAPASLGPAIVKADCIRVRTHQDILPRYLMWALNSPEVRGVVGASIKGVGRPRVNLSDLRHLQIPMAPAAEQVRIVAAIEESFSKLTAGEDGLRSVRQLLRRMRDAILTAAVTGRLVSQDPSDTSAAKLLADLGAERMAMHEAAGWAWARLGEAVGRGAITDGPFGSNLKTSHYRASGPRVVRLQNIGDGVFRDERAHIDDAHFMQLQRHHVRGGDVLVASLGELLPRACLAPDWLGPAIVKADCLRIRPGGALNGSFLTHVLNSSPVRSAVTASIKGVGRPRVNLGDLRALAVPVPPAAEQLRIVGEIERQNSFIYACEQAVDAGLARSEALRRSVLKAAFEGRLVPQDPTDEPASVLLDRVRQARAATGQRPRRSRPVRSSS